MRDRLRRAAALLACAAALPLLPLLPLLPVTPTVSAGTVDGAFQGIGAIGPDSTLDVRITGRGPIPTDGIDAVVLTITSTRATNNTHLTVWPTGQPRPNTSNLNITAGQTIANTVITRVGDNGTISIHNAAGTTHLVIDIAGWYPTGTTYTPINPIRLTDTRPTPVVVITEMLDMRSCTDLADVWCEPFASVDLASTVMPVCATTGDPLQRTDPGTVDEPEPIEYLLVTRPDGTEGFVERSGLAATGAPDCSTVPRVRAGLAAIDRIGEAFARPTDAAYYHPYDWGRLYGEWSGDCKKLVASAWRDAGTVLVAGHAKWTFDWYRARGSARGTGRIAPYGSLVGFDVSLPFGHMAVSIGGNRLVTTLGREGSRTPNGVRTTDLYGNYRGWVLP